MRSDGTVVFANAETAKLTGYDRLEIEHRTFWLEAVHPEDAWKLMNAVRRTAEGQAQRVVVRFLSRHRGPRLAEMHLYPSSPDAELLTEVVIFDVTQQNEVEEALYQSEALYRTFLEQSPIGMLHIDAAGTVTFENHQFRQIVGEEVEDAWIGRSLYAIEGLDRRLTSLIRSMLDNGERVDGELISFRRSDSRRHLKFHGSPILHPEAGIVGAVMMVEDRTEEVRRRAELQLRSRYASAESALRKAAFSNSLEDGFLDETARVLGESCQADRSYVVVANAAGDCCADRAHWQRDGVSPLDSLVIMHTEDADLREIAQGEYLHLNKHTSAEEGCALLQRTGASQAVWIPFWEDARLAGYLVAERIDEPTGDDVSPWTQSELDLLQQLTRLFETLWGWMLAGNRYRHITSAIDDCLFNFTFDEDGERKYLFLTTQVESLTGYRTDDLMGKGKIPAVWSNEIVHEEDRRSIDAHDDLLRGGRESRTTYRVHHRDGSIRWLREHATAEQDPMGDVIVSGILTDVTEQKKGEAVLVDAKHQAESANQLKSAFIATMSHEIRTPLGAVNGFSELLSHELVEHAENTGIELPPQIVEFLQAIQENSKKLLVVVNDLFDLSNLEEGAVEIRSVDVPVNEVVMRSAAKIAEALSEKDVQLRVDLHASDPVVIADPQRLEQVLDNLLSNAVKFTDEGSVTVHTAPTGNGRTLLEVTDTGVGMSDQYQGRLFEPFVQEDSRLNRQFEGSGLGLSLVKRLLDLMDGTIEVESRKGEGSTFRISLPLS